MRVTIDTDRGEIVSDGETLPLYSRAGFELLSKLWLKVGWNQKYTYTFSWFGRPMIQLPEDMFRLQEAIYRVKPDVIIETGVAHGGSLIFHASLCKAMDHGRVIGVEIALRAPNRAAIETHELAPLITLVDGGSTDPETVAKVRSLIAPDETAMVLFDSNHSKAHVAAELEAYAPLVTPGSYLVAMDGLMEDLTDVPRGEAGWATDNPAEAARDFAARHPEFTLEQPPWPFNESDLGSNVTHWNSAWLRRC